jgi:hypothetical protein
MSYLRGPLTRRQVQGLMRDVKASEEETEGATEAQPAIVKAKAAAVAGEAVTKGLAAHRPALPPDVEQVFLPVRLAEQQALRALEDATGQTLQVQDARLVYEPMLLGMGTVGFVDRKHGVDERREAALLLEPGQSRALMRWEEAKGQDITYRDLEDRPYGEPLFVDVPPVLNTARKLKGLENDFSDYLYRSQAVVLSHSQSLDLVAHPDESAREFTVRCREAAREKRDAEVDKLSEKYKRKIDQLQDRLRREERELADDEAEYAARKREELLSAGESVIGLFIGRRSTRSLSTASRRRRFTTKAKLDVEESQETIADLQKDIAELQAEMEEEADLITRRWAEALDEVGELRITPRRADVSVDLFGLAWAPRWEITYEDARGRERTDGVPAFASGQVGHRTS